MTACRRFVEQLDDFVAGRCDDEETRWMEAHVCACARCRAEVTAAQVMRDGVRAAWPRAATEEAADDVAAFLAGVRARLREPQEAGYARGTGMRPGRSWRWAIGMAAVGVAVAVALVTLWGPLRGPTDDRRIVEADPLQRVHGVDAGMERPSERPATEVAARTAQSPPSRTEERVREGGLCAVPARDFNRRVPETEYTPRLLAPPTPAARPVLAGDLAHVNLPPAAAFARWTRVPEDEMTAAAERLRRETRGGDEFVSVPPPRIAADGPESGRAAAAALAAHKRESAVVDPRLIRKLTLAFKATALSDVCDRLRTDTGIELTAGRSVADEKVTLFCRDAPLRDIMRQLSRPFGYTWLRTGKEGQYRYELAQDLRSQLLEEDLRNRDRNAALQAVDQEMESYRRYLGLSPEELRGRMGEGAPLAPGERRISPQRAGAMWGPMQMYFRLSPADLAALRAGQKLTFSPEPDPGELLLPPELAKGVLQGDREHRVVRRGEQLDIGRAAELPDGLPLASVPEAKPVVTLRMDVSELGQLTLRGESGFGISTPTQNVGLMMDSGPLAIGVSPAVGAPRNRETNAKLARDPGLRPRISVTPQPSCRLVPIPSTEERAPGEPRCTTADVLEALHRATGMNLVSDYYTRLYEPTAVSAREQTIFETLCRLADAMRMRWQKDGGWLQFRSTSFFHDRLKEVPNRLLTRWSESRKKHGALTLEDLVEIGQLTDAQLDSRVMAEGACSCFGLKEWNLGSNRELRRHWRYLARLTPEQRRQAATPQGLPFRQLLLPQQQEFLAIALGRSENVDVGQVDMAGARLQIAYTQPGAWEWQQPVDGPQRLEVQLRAEGPGGPRERGPGPGPRPRREERTPLPSPVQARTKEAALAAARKIDSGATEREIAPTELAVFFAYHLGGENARLSPLALRAGPLEYFMSTPERVEP